MTWSCLDGGLLSHLLGAFWPFRTDGFWRCMGLPWHYKMANQFFSKNTSTKSQTWKEGVQKTPLQNHKPGGGGCKKIKTTPLQNHKPGGGCANNHFSHIYILGSPLGSSISSHTSKINQNDRTRILNSFPINQTSTNFLYKIRAHYKMTGPGVFKFIANQPNINQFSLQNQGPLQNQRTGPLKYS